MHVCRCLCRCVFVDDITLHICLQGHVWSRMCFSQDFCRAAHLHLPSPGSWSEGCISEVLPMLHNWHAESRPRWAAWKLWCGTSPAAQCDKEKLEKWNFNLGLKHFKQGLMMDDVIFTSHPDISAASLMFGVFSRTVTNDYLSVNDQKWRKNGRRNVPELKVMSSNWTKIKGLSHYLADEVVASDYLAFFLPNKILDYWLKIDNMADILSFFTNIGIDPKNPLLIQLS